MTVRFYSSIAQQTTLTSSISSSTTVINVAATTGFPSSTPFTLSLDYGAPNEELVEVTLIAGTSLTVTRAIDGTSATLHNAGAIVRHVSSARDFSDSRNHENSTTNIHGLAPGSAIVGTNDAQTLSNKTFIDATGTFNRILIKNGATGGAWTTTIQGDPAQTSADLQNWKPTNAANSTATLGNNGAFTVINTSALDTSATSYRLRATKSDGTTDIFSVQSSGLVSTKQTNGSNGFKAVSENDSPVSGSIAFAVRNAADSATRGAWFNHGGVSLLGNAPSVVQLYVKAPAAQATDIMQIQDQLNNTLVAVGSTGRLFAQNGSRLIGGSGAGDTGAEIRPGSGGANSSMVWTDGSGTAVGNMSPSGILTAVDLTLTGGAWTGYTPVLTAATTNPTIGNGSIIGRYKQYGKTIHFAIEFVFGSTSTAGSGAWSISLPPSLPVTNASGTPVFVANCNGSVGGFRFHADATLAPTATTFQMFAPTSNTQVALTTVQQTVMGNAWANGNFIRITGTYETQ